jgi:hypothetical protein
MSLSATRTARGTRMRVGRSEMCSIVCRRATGPHLQSIMTTITPGASDGYATDKKRRQGENCQGEFGGRADRSSLGRGVRRGPGRSW